MRAYVAQCNLYDITQRKQPFVKMPPPSLCAKPRLLEFPHMSPKEQIAERIAPILREYDVRRAGVFGSFARGDFTANSDVDLLVSFNKVPGLFAYLAMIEKLKVALSRPVDVLTDSALDPHMRPYVEADLATVYDAR